MSNIKKGFTLIELLVVIAIIGILATVVLSSLGTARTRATDAKTQAQVSGSRAQAEIIAGGANGSYDTVCAGLAAFGAVDGTNCHDSATAWAFSAAITGGYFCADSTGKTATSTTVVAGTAC